MTAYRVLKVFLKVILSNVSDDHNEALAKRCLIQNVTYRLPASAGEDRLIGFKVLYRLITKAVQIDQQLVSETSGNAVLNGDFKYLELVITYLKKQEIEVDRFYVKDDSGNFRSLGIASKICVLMIGIASSIHCLFIKKGRSNIALLARELTESMNLTASFQKESITKLYDYMPYEKDSNVFYLVLNEFGITHVKLVSPSPIALHNKVLLSDILIYNTPYQVEEILEFSDTIRVKSTAKWPPEFAYTYIDQYVNSKSKESEKGVGFYSHASWIRKLEGHAKIAMNIGSEEVELLGMINKLDVVLIDKTPVQIFYHPREKNEDMLPATTEFYGTVLSDQMFEFSLLSKSTAQLFNTVNIGLSAYSTIIYERLFCGFKTLVYTPTDGDNAASFPLPNSAIRNICFRNFEELVRLLEFNAPLSDSEFFSVNGLEGYAHWGSTDASK